MNIIKSIININNVYFARYYYKFVELGVNINSNKMSIDFNNDYIKNNKQF